MAFTQQTPIGTPDADLITQTLAKLQPDSALQDYARMHKNDIYIVSLANAESNRRKALRLAAQGNPGQQPTVVDQDIAGMAPAPVMAQTQLPENQGIARIPAPNMRHLADGGIAGFDESTNAPVTTQRLDNMGNTGGMFNYAQDGGGVMRMSGGGHIPRYQGIPKAKGGDGSLIGDIPNFQAVQPRAEFTQEGSPENKKPWEMFTDYMGEQKKQAALSEIAYRINKGIATPDEIKLYNDEKVKAGDKAATEAKYPSNTATRAKDFPGVKSGFENPPVDMPGSTAAVKKIIDSAGQASSKVAGDYPTTAEGYRKRLDTLMGSPADVKNPFSTQQGEIAAEEKAAALERSAALEKSITARGEAFKGKEGRLAEREARLGKEDERNTGLALLEAGLGMMTSRGPGLTGIAEGAKSGVASYAAGKQRLLAAKEKVDDARDQIEEYRRNETNMTDKERRAAQDDINRTVIQGKKDALAGTMKAYDVNAAQATKILELSSADERVRLENASRERAAGAGSPQALYRLLGGGDIEKGYRLATEIQAGKKTMTQAYEAYVTATAGKDTTINPPLTPEQFVKQMKTIQALEKGVPGAIEGKPDRQ